MKTVFEAFPNAVEHGWSFGRVVRGTEVGSVFKEMYKFEPLVDSGNRAMFKHGASADSIVYDVLLYVKPSALPNLNTAKLVSAYMVKGPDGSFYDILTAEQAKNQETGRIEHYELTLGLTEAEVEVEEGYECND